MAITALPDIPQRSDPATFSTKADAFLGALPTFVTEANALQTDVNAKQAAAAVSAAAAVVSQTAASAAAAAASAAAAAASAAAALSGDIALAAANYKGPWSSQSGAANIPYSVSHLGVFWMITSNLADVSAKTPGTDPEWLSISAPIVALAAKTGDATLSATELAGNYIITNTGAGGAINLTLQAGASNLSCEFEVTVAQYLKVTAAGSDKFRFYDQEGAAGGYIRSNVVGTRFKITWSGGNWSLHDVTGEINADE